MTSPRIIARGPHAVLFADICHSTGLYEQLGDTQALTLVSKAFSLLHEVTFRRNGRVVRTFGDEVLCLFEQADPAARAACEMHLAIKKDPMLARVKMALKAGLHFGEVIVREDDIYGDAVNVAARAVSLARKDQIITTGDTLRAVPSTTLISTRNLGRIGVKGRIGDLDFHEILWRGDQGDGLTLTDTLQLEEMGRSPSAALTLEYQGQRLELGKARSLVYIGRSDDNDLVMPHHFVSRVHATIEYRNAKFLLTDHSTNGLYVKMGTSQPVFVHRDQVTLLGEGMISPGRELSHPGAEIIRYGMRIE
jgi:class 3 adenylate cyclase